MPEQEWLLIPEPMMVQSNVLAKELCQAVIAMAEALPEMRSPANEKPAFSSLERLPA